MPRWKQLVHEAHRRSLWQVLGIYLAGSWVAMQVVETLTANVGLPDWVPPFAVVLLVIGFPIVMATAFVQEGMPGRESAEGGGSALGALDGAAAVGRDPAATGPDVRPSPAATARSADSGETAAPPREQRGEDGVHHRLFTWRNAILGGVLAFALLGLVTTIYLAMRSLGIGPVGSLVARGVLEERAPIVVAEFEATDPLLARAVTEAFRVDLSQSDIVTVVEPSELHEVLVRMQRDPGVALDLEVAREVALREGFPAVIAGEVNQAGTSTVISARLISTADGEVLASYRQTAGDSTMIVPAVDGLSKRFRQRIGESLRTIRAGPPLERVTTADLAALRKYSQGAQAAAFDGDLQRAVALFQEAVALDTGFASAYRALGSVYGNMGERALSIEAYSNAFAHRDRLSERERYAAEAIYYENVTGERDKAIVAYRNQLEIAPNDHAALNNLGNNYEYLRDFARAEELFRASLEQDSGRWIPYWNAAAVQVAQGEFEEARGTIEALARTSPGSPTVFRARALLAAAGRDFGATEESLRSMRQATTGSAGATAYASSALAAVDYVHGRLEEGGRHNEEALALNVERGSPATALQNVLFAAWVELSIRDDADGAVRQVESAITEHGLDEVPVQDWGYLDLASFYAAAGRPDRARELHARRRA